MQPDRGWIVLQCPVSQGLVFRLRPTLNHLAECGLTQLRQIKASPYSPLKQPSTSGTIHNFSDMFLRQSVDLRSPFCGAGRGLPAAKKIPTFLSRTANDGFAPWLPFPMLDVTPETGHRMNYRWFRLTVLQVLFKCKFVSGINE
jgi:hypothetical protein